MWKTPPFNEAIGANDATDTIIAIIGTIVAIGIIVRAVDIGGNRECLPGSEISERAQKDQKTKFWAVIFENYTAYLLT